MSSLIYDGLEFREKDTLDKYIMFKRRFRVSSFLSIVTLVPALILLFSSFLQPSSNFSYIYLVPLAISVPFSVLGFRANSRLTEIINSDEVRHV